MTIGREDRYFERVLVTRLPLFLDVRRWLIFAATLAGVILLFVLLSTPAGIGQQSAGRWPSVLPPIIAILLSICFRRVVFAMTIALIAGAFLAYGPEPWIALPEGFSKLIWENLRNEFNLYILAFTFSLMGMVHVMSRSGGLHGMMDAILKAARGARSTRIVTAFMGLAIFFDDYASSVIVGTTMRSAADRQRISREKLAYIVDSTSAPVAGLAVISTWIGFEVGLLNDISERLGIGMNGYEIFFAIFPFRFYCFTALLFVFMNTVSNRDFGPMYRAELRGLLGEVNGQRVKPAREPVMEEIRPPAEAPRRWINAVIPIVTVILGFLTGIVWVGREAVYEAGLRLSLLDPSVWLASFGAVDDDTSRILFLCATLGSLVAIILAVTQGILSLREATAAWLKAIPTIGPAATILLLAWALKTLCTEVLRTDLYLIAVLGEYLSIELLPVVTFLTAAGISFATGTSWGTMGILLPVALPLAHAMGAWDDGSSLIFWLTAGAVLDGAIFGDHCSPISDTTVLSSIASGCDHFAHVWTQAPYAIICMVLASGIGYLGTVFGLPLSLAYLLLGVGIAGVLRTMGKHLPETVNSQN
ncbi:MAG: Na+/H+ antiporter NhaC family protein [Deltaproteobacteria bacterium]|nr:Na+/H+ antiporter NhaC family protein [Deltaproteobacteria bacterium]